MKSEQFDKVIVGYSKQFKNNRFTFDNKDDLCELIKRKDVPHLPGVYIIYRSKNKHREVVYIGKSGRMKQKGKFKGQMLDERLSNKQQGRSHLKFCSPKNSENKSKLDVQWFVTWEEKAKTSILPGRAEASLMQAFYDDTGKLPRWNKSF